jgi:hypothetical protein
MSEKFMSEKVVSVYENDNLRSATVNAVGGRQRLASGHPESA